MTGPRIKPARPIRTAGPLRPAWAGPKEGRPSYGAKMTALTSVGGAANAAAVKRVRNITNNLRFYNQVTVKISLYHSARAYGRSASAHGRIPDVRDFAADLIDDALRRELDREITVMARGENVASNQRRQRVLGKYLLSKPYRTIQNFYGIRMQRLAASAPAEKSGEGKTFYSDIIHERVDKTVYSPAQTQIERVTVPSEHPASISDGDLTRIAERAAKQVERKMRSERERNGKW